MQKTDNNKDLIGFSLSKIFNKYSIFRHQNAVLPLLSLVDALSEHVHQLPTSEDSAPVKLFRMSAYMYSIWSSVASPLKQIDKALPHSNPLELKGASNIIMSLISDLGIEPCEVYKSDRRRWSAIGSITSYPIGDGFLYESKTFEGNSRFIAISNNITQEYLVNFLWSKWNNSISLEFSHPSSYVEEEDSETGIKCPQTKLNDKDLFGSSLEIVNTLCDNHLFYKNNNISRTYLLIGKPGTGKTSIIREFIKKIGGKSCLVSGFSNSSIDNLKTTFSLLNPDFIVFEDCDRGLSSSTIIRDTLVMLEEIKEICPQTTLLFTANTFNGILKDDAIIRKGRIDQIIEIPPPNKEDRTIILKEYLKKFNITLSDEDFNLCIERSDELTGADLKDLCIRLMRITAKEYFDQLKQIENLKEKYEATMSFNDKEYV